MSQRNTTISFCMIVGALILFDQGDAYAQSIWMRRTDEHAYLFYDTRARNVGDLVTVLISQETDLDSREDRRMNKETESSGFFGFDFKTGGGLGANAADAAMDFKVTSERDFDGQSDYRNSQELTDRMTATVTSVFPNGNMVISGQRETMIAGESRFVTLSGVIRPIDLRPDNSIHSQFIADFQLVCDGDGASQSFTRQGWFARKVNHLWPF
ncbi:Flagellar L-ring protein precursor [Thalassoglobus neptunius]|uniref:Flagellar L-ring protein n=1 Tax=Thalassoglobus neptunius TaxID=1938619 RepID=A0A5C5VY10_9PLAN|nr:flagellar basal body L-ring protein FlgH [Thalassoglobus neptunius]TWT43017.1 Flagellar L-ring protein precursor [Thalassoglobus neptunius]